MMASPSDKRLLAGKVCVMTQTHRLVIAGGHHRQIYRLHTGQCPVPHHRGLRGGVCERAGQASDIGEIGEVGRQTGSGAGDDSDVSLPSAAVALCRPRPSERHIPGQSPRS